MRLEISRVLHNYCTNSNLTELKSVISLKWSVCTKNCILVKHFYIVNIRESTTVTRSIHSGSHIVTVARVVLYLDNKALYLCLKRVVLLIYCVNLLKSSDRTKLQIYLKLCDLIFSLKRKNNGKKKVKIYYNVNFNYTTYYIFLLRKNLYLLHFVLFKFML